MSENNKDCIIVLSGGMDSVTLLHEYKERIALAVTFDYGSNHNAREIECARRQCAMLGIRHLVIPLKFMAEYFRSSLLDGAEAIPEGNYDDDNMKSTVVPFRNGIMLSVACGLAESNDLQHVLIANHGGDHTIYPDCRPGFVDAMGEAMRQGTFNGVKILAPYTLITKGDIARRGAEMGVDYSLTYSCYKGGERHCGKCGTCMERREAFAAAGIDDPTDYED
ncbi:MAG TPA: 7-cyano-7-deazaguanine synthase QueC [Porphyromonadaceae bacterium]|nr:7-cyano-7-deazaguanine synthase QueC [Porphyromonadaceae bacterium]